MSQYKLSDFDYNLPEDLIAQHPAKRRTHSRLMVVKRDTGEIIDDKFYNILNYIVPSYYVVMNRTKVIPARLYGKKPTGGKVEILLLDQLSDGKWRALVKPGRRLKKGNRMIFANGLLKGEICKHLSKGERVIEFDFEGNFFEIIDKIGEVPLPPYIKREASNQDKTRYQTVFASEEGSVAAPTAGLHFNDELLKKMQDTNLGISYINLKIGLDTFRPVTVENIEEHPIHSEFCQIKKKAAGQINKAINTGEKILAVGTTSVRTLESFWENGTVNPGTKRTELYIYPGYKFKVTDALLTNFHLPRSSLLMLVTAFGGYDLIMKAYETAVQEEFRFFSYGDVMLIL